MFSDPVSLLAASALPEPLLPLWAMELLASAFFYAWLFCLGATIGSFLNVVVYRLPRGLNLAYPGSFCPRCGHAIRLDDNIPIMSWLLLGGRCRDCGGRISPRYLFVELTVAILFLLVLLAEHYLPAGALGFHTRQLLSARDGIPFWCMYGTHVVLLTTFVGMILIVSDGFPVPRGLFLPIILVGLVLPIMWPAIRSVPAVTYPNENVWWAGLVDGLLGLAAALLFHGIVSRIGELPRLAPRGSSATIGVVLGWQRSSYALPLTILACLVAAVVLRRISGKVSDAGQPPFGVAEVASPEQCVSSERPESSGTAYGGPLSDAHDDAASSSKPSSTP